MTKSLLTALAFAFSLGANAQTDASAYFTGSPFGWGTCSDKAGTVYNLNGGYGTGSPSTTTLKASGAGSDNAAILDAIKKYDVVILDGSNGSFIIDGQIRFQDIRNKTIIGHNNARLKTKFELTADLRAYLKKQGLEGLSSTKQITGTLPDGTTVTCDERAFYTKKAMMEYTKDLKQTYAQAGIFYLNDTDQNIIFRNLTFEGPGSIDVDGVDLISQYGANYVWVDHCTFIDGLDGNLDSGKRKNTPMFVSYTWNKFYYTEKSYSHPYSNGTGWMNGENRQYITYANCWWADKCGRRLPQVDDADIHLLNNYYSCTGNSAGVAINDRCNAIIEGNYAVDGVKDAISVVSSNSYLTKDNYFTSTSTFNTNLSHNNPTPVPYEYTFIPLSDVKSVITGTYGAGATLTNELAMPKVKANEESKEGVFYTFLEAEKVGGFSTITFSDGAKLALTGNKDKAYTSGKSILIGADKYTATKLSNGAENTFYAPAGKKVASVTFYSYINTESTARVNYWKKVNGVQYYTDGSDKPQTNVMECLQDFDNPDVNSFNLGGVSEFKFQNSGDQLAFVMEVKYVSDGPTGISHATVSRRPDAALYSLDGRRVVGTPRPGVYVSEGRKVYLK